MQKEIGHLEKKLETTAAEMQTASKAAEKVSNSVAKRIEDVVVKELPERYLSFGGLRNWKLLNKDVATI